MWRFALIAAACCTLPSLLHGADADFLADRKVVFLGDSITQAGGYISIMNYALQRQFPEKSFDFYGLGLASETVSGLTEENHAGGAFPRPCLHERLKRLLDRVQPDVVIACYGMNDGIYKPLDPVRFEEFQQGITRLIDEARKAGAKQVYLITPPIYDFTAKAGEFNYDTVLTEYAAWEMKLKLPGVKVIDLHTPLRAAREARSEPLSPDRVHPNDEGQLAIANILLEALGAAKVSVSVAELKADSLFKLVDQKRQLRWTGWMNHIGYTREKTIEPQPLGETEVRAAKLQAEIDQLLRK